LETLKEYIVETIAVAHASANNVKKMQELLTFPFVPIILRNSISNVLWCHVYGIDN